MKNNLFLILLFFSSIGLIAQNCDIYIPMKEGAHLQYQVKDKRERDVSTIDYRVKKIEHTSQGDVLTIETSVKEGKNKVIEKQDFKAVCKGNVMTIDFESLVPSHLKESLKDFDYKITGNDLEWPANLNVGQKLNDSDIKMSMSMGGMNMDVTVKLTNRRVERKESLTTPAGTFDCYVVSHDTKTNMMGQSFESSTTQWISKGVGMVKTEDYDKGKVESTTLLTSFSK